MLKPRKKIAKKEIKEDPVVKLYVNFQKYLRNNSKYINIVIGSVAVILLIILFSVKSKKKAEMAAEGQLGVAEQYYYQGAYDRVIQQMPAIVDKYAGTRAAGEAAFFIANSYYNSKNYDNSLKYYQICIKTISSDPVYTPASYAGMGDCLEMQKKYKEAAEMYEKAANKFEKLFSAPFYLKSAARCYEEAGNSAKAKEILQALLDNYPLFEYKSEVAFLLNTLNHN